MPATNEISHRRAGDYVYLDAQATCGMKGHQTFPNVAVVYEPDGPMPAIIIARPLGVTLVQQIVDYVNARPWRQEGGD